MSGLPSFDACTFTARTTDDGRFVYQCDQFTNLRSKPYFNRLDALDDVMTKTRAKLAQIDDARDDRKAAPRR